MARLTTRTAIARIVLAVTFLASFSTQSKGQSYLVGTVAGGGLPPTPATAVGATIPFPTSIAVDTGGDLYFTAENCVFKVYPQGVLTLVAGFSPLPGYAGDGSQATTAQFNTPSGVAVDGAGNLYIADSGNNRIRKVAALNGIITTVAGNGSVGYSGDNGLATAAQLTGPSAVAVDSSGNLYIADSGNFVIREVVAATGIITTVAGNGTYGYSGDNGPATSAQLSFPEGVAVDTAGNLYIADSSNGHIRKVTASTGTITTVAQSYSQFITNPRPSGIAVDTSGNLYIGDTIFVFEVSATSGAATVIGSTLAPTFFNPLGVAVDLLGNVFFNDAPNGTIVEIPVASPDTPAVAAGKSITGYSGYSGDGGPATGAQLNAPTGVTLDGAGNLYIADAGNNRVRKVAAATDIITTLTTASGVNDIVSDAAGNLYLSTNALVTKIAEGTGIVTTVAGGGSTEGNGGPATSAMLANAQGLALDTAGNLYIADAGSNQVRKVTADTGIITTVAGASTGQSGYTGDGGAATSALLTQPAGVAVDASGNLFIADTGDFVVREVAAATGIITTVAGFKSGPTSPYSSGDGGPATSAQFESPVRVAVSPSGNLYIADANAGNVRKVVLATGIISTILGANSDAGLTSVPMGLTVSTSGYLYVADQLNGLVTLVNDSGAPAAEITPGNAASSDNLTFDLLIAEPSQAHGNQSPTGTTVTLTAGGTVGYTQTLVRDAASPAASNVVVTSALPPGWTFTSCQTAGGTCAATGGSSLTIAYPSIASGQSPSITYTADGPSTRGWVPLESSATSASENLATDSVSQNLLAFPGAEMWMAFSASSAQEPAGQPVTYTVTLTNGGSSGGVKLAGDPLTVTIALNSALTGIVAPVPGVGDPAWSCTQNAFTLVCTNTSAVVLAGQTSFAVSANVPASEAVGANLTSQAVFGFGGMVSQPLSAGVSIIVPPPPAPVLVSPANGATVSPSLLTWSAAPGASFYAVYFGTSNPPALVAYGTTALTYALPALTSGATYYWSVSAGNSSGTTSSPVWSFLAGASSGCQFTLSSNSVSLTNAGTATTSVADPNGVIPDIAVAVPIIASAGTCGAFTATSSAAWLAASAGAASFAYTALSNTHSTLQSGTITVTNAGGGSQTFTVTEAGDPESVGDREVRALYQSILGRDPDSGGFAFWTGVGAAGLGQMADDFLTSPESFNSDFAVMAAYQAGTGAPPSFAQFTAAVASLRAGTQTAAELFNLLTGAGYSATNLYENLLSRAPGSADASCNAVSLSQCFQTIIGYPASNTPVGAPNNEFQNTGSYQTAPDHSNALYVQMLYYTILSRNPDASGLAFWLGVANSGGPGILFQGAAGYATRIQILGPGTPGQGFVGSAEFQGLFGN